MADAEGYMSIEEMDEMLKNVDLSFLNRPSEKTLEVVRNAIKQNKENRILVHCDFEGVVFDIDRDKVRLIRRNAGIGIELLRHDVGLTNYDPDLSTIEKLIREKYEEDLKATPYLYMPEPECSSYDGKVPHHKRGFINKKGPQGRKPWR